MHKIVGKIGNRIKSVIIPDFEDYSEEDIIRLEQENLTLQMKLKRFEELETLILDCAPDEPLELSEHQFNTNEVITQDELEHILEREFYQLMYMLKTTYVKPIEEASIHTYQLSDERQPFCFNCMWYRDTSCKLNKFFTNVCTCNFFEDKKFER